jgi:hypothetical protein
VDLLKDKPVPILHIKKTERKTEIYNYTNENKNLATNQKENSIHVLQ